MTPTLSHGDIVFVDTNAYSKFTPADGDVVVATHPSMPHIEIIKRVEFSNDGWVYLVSDNRTEQGAIDSRSFGLVSNDMIIGKVTATAKQ